MRSISFEEVQRHRSGESCWVILYGYVYDVTNFLSDHPGGSSVILRLAGTDATEEYDPIHPSGILEQSLPVEAKVGRIDETTLPQKLDLPATRTSQPEAIPSQAPSSSATIDCLDDCLNLDDIEVLATKKISDKAWGYYYSASDDLFSKQLNNKVYQKILLRPRIFVDCTRCSISTKMLGNSIDLPIFVSPAAMARLGHPDGEAGIARACAKYGAVQIISNNASQRPEEIVADATLGQIFGWQLYVQDDRKKSEAMLARINRLLCVKFIILTLDAPVPGKREHDERQKNVGANLPLSSSVKTSGGVGKALFAGTAADLTWNKTLKWLEQHTSLPIILKGIQTHEDAYIAMQHTPQVRGILLSNHGGRALDTAPPAIHTLLEIRKYCPEVFEKLEIFVDGGIRRGTDVVKALALGARAVGIGRAALYGLGAGGQAGVERVLEILKAETETAMRLLGCEVVSELSTRHVNAREVLREIFDGTAGLEEALTRSRL